MNARRIWLIGLVVALAAAMGLLLSLGLRTEEVTAQETSWLRWEVAWGQQDVPWGGNWTNVTAVASPSIDIFVSRLGAWLSTSYTMTLSQDILTETYSTDNHISTPYAFYLSWKQGEDPWAGTHWYRDVCMPGPKVGFVLIDDLENGNMEVSNPTTETWRIWFHAHDNVYTSTLYPGDTFRVQPVSGHNLIDVVNNDGATCVQVWWLKPRLDTIKWVETTTVHAGSWVTYNVLVNNVGSSLTDVFITDTWSLPISTSVTSLTIPWSSSQSYITATNNGYVLYIDSVNMNLTASIWYRFYIPEDYSGQLINCTQTSSSEGWWAEDCNVLQIEPQGYGVFLPMVVNH